MLKVKLRILLSSTSRVEMIKAMSKSCGLCMPLFLERQLRAAEKTEAAARKSLRSMQPVLQLSRSSISRRLVQSNWKGLGFHCFLRTVWQM
jgi:hypothetical protein